MRNIIIPILTLIAFSCNELKPRKPLNKKQMKFLEQSAKRNKNLFSNEQVLIKEAIQRDSLLRFSSSTLGYWFAYKRKSKLKTSLPAKGNKVVISYEIADLNQNVLYTEAELGEITFFVDKEDLLPALREGVKIMRPGDIVVFLFPSYLCYGYQGDGEKIKVNQPLRITIHLKSLVKKES